MSHLFCHTCGFKIQYANVKPNFCSKCGQQLNMSLASTFSKPSIEEIDDSIHYDLQNDETLSDSIPNISKIQVEYSMEDYKTHTVGSLAGKPPNERGRKPRSKSVNEFLNEKRSRSEKDI